MVKRAMSPEGRGRLYLVAAPTYPMLSDSSIRTTVEICRMLGVYNHDSLKRQPPSLLLPNNSEILFRSADDPERLRGPNLSGVWLDEASLMSHEA
jgi:phage terminase large subunit